MANATKKFSTLPELIRSLEGTNTVITSVEKSNLRNISVRWEKRELGLKDMGVHSAHYCQTCGCYYFGEAPTNEIGQKYCRACNRFL